MRKSLLLFLVALIMPALAFAVDNKAISKTKGTYSNTEYATDENIVYVDYNALGWEQAATPDEGANFSIGMWFKTTSIFNNDIKKAVLMRLGTADHNNNNGAIQLMHSIDGSLEVSLGGDNTGGPKIFDGEQTISCGTASLNEWHYALVCFDSANKKVTVYVDGSKTAEETATGVFGYKWADGVFAFCGYEFTGLIDEIQMFNAPLTADEAAKAYNNEANSISSLTALYDFNAIKSGTTGQFESVAGLSTAAPATFENATFKNWWAGGPVYRQSNTEIAPTLVDGREIEGGTVDPDPDPDPVEDPTYCTPTGKGCEFTNWQLGNYFHGSRFVRTITVSDGTSSVSVEGTTTATSNVPNHQQNFYYDRTATVLNTTPGATINIDVDGVFHWRTQYIYVDFGRDGTFDYDKTTAAVNNDLVAHTGYDPSGANPTQTSDGTPSLGSEGLGNYGNSTFPVPSFTLPSNMAPGRYRIRYVVAWNNPDPCFTTTKEADKGTIIDFTLNVEGSIEPRTVAVETENADYGTVAIQGTEEMSVETEEAVTVVATPAEGFTFMNWTDNTGKVVSTAATYTYKGTEDVTLTAHFGYTVTIESGEGGTLSVVDGEGNPVATGTIVAPGTQLTINAYASGDYRLVSIVVNGNVVENGETIEANSAMEISASFSDSPFVVKINQNEGGSVAVCDDYDENYNAQGTIWTNNAPIAEAEAPYIIIKPEEGYEIATLSITGDDDEPFSYEKNDIIEDGRVYDLADEELNGFVFYCVGLTADLEITVQFATKTAGIDGIDADNANAPVEYFNLQGIRVNADNLTPGIYVTRQGSKTVKVLVK